MFTLPCPCPCPDFSTGFVQTPQLDAGVFCEQLHKAAFPPCLPACLLACLPACLLACLLACSLACLLVHVFPSFILTASPHLTLLLPRLQDLLQLQYEGVAVMKMFGRAKINVNLLIFLLNRKFYGKQLIINRIPFTCEKCTEPAEPHV